MYLYMPSPSQQFVAQHSVDFFASATFLSYVLSSVRHYGLFGRQRVYVSNTCGRDWLRKSWRHSQRDWPRDSRRGSPRELPRDWRPYAFPQFPLLPFTFCAFYLPPAPRLPSTFSLPPSTLYLLPSTFPLPPSYPLPSAFCLPPSTFCLLPSPFPLLPSTFCRLPSPFPLLQVGGESQNFDV